MQGVEKSFGPVQALQGVDLEVRVVCYRRSEAMDGGLQRLLTAFAA